MNSRTFPAIIILIILLTAIPAHKRRLHFVKNITRKGKRNMLPKEMIKEFIGKVCYINVFDTSMSTYARVLDIEENWLKVKNDQGNISMINGDMIKTIEVAKEKYQSRCK